MISVLGGKGEKMLIHKTMKMPTSCLSCWIAPTCEVWVREKSKYKGYDNRLENCPLEEVKRGYWKTDERYPWREVCSECHMYITYDADSNAEMNYCPNCGAKMDEVLNAPLHNGKSMMELERLMDEVTE